ncbi:MAG: FAD-dependent monooxygenase [Cyanobacteria bacterium SZAS LIN-3]|nr:FAD-dependent monooxygenase [Cyanobacteria bacterium SZAS LIN-3]
MTEEVKSALDIAIIGGGIGGLTLGLALHKFGLSCTVYEGHAEAREAGAGIWVSPNAMQVLQRLDLNRLICAEGYELDAIELLDYRAGRLQTISLRSFQQQYGHGIIAIKRTTLRRILAEELERRSGKPVVYGRSARNLGHNKDEAVVEFADGSSAKSPCLIGADGLRSAVRAHLFPQAQPRYTGQTSWRKIVSATLPEEWKTTSVEIWGKGVRFGFSCIGAGQVYWYATADCQSMACGGRILQGPDGEMALSDIFTGFPPIVAQLIHAPAVDQASVSRPPLPQDDAVRTDIYDLPPLARWHMGPIALLGDAAHATSPNLGQGGAQAIEDAYVLAQALRDCSSTAEAFSRYQALREVKANKVVRRSRTFGRLAHWRSDLARTLRNTAIRLTPERINLREVDELYRLNF